MKKLASLLLVLILALTGFALAEDKIEIGFVSAGPDDYYNVSAEVVKLAGAKLGWEVTVLNSEYTPEKEISNVEDLITKGVDGILIIAANMDSAQTATQKANEAGIPIVFVAGGPGAGAGVPDSIVAGNWTFSGDWHAKNLNEVKPGAKVALAMGVAGQDIGNLITEAFKAAFEGEIVEEQYCDWSRAAGMEFAQNLISKMTEVDVIFAYNEEIAAGVKQAYEEAGYQPGEVWIISNNGKAIGLEMLAGNWMQYTIEFAPTSEAYAGVLTMKAILEGKEVNAVVDNPAVCLSAENLDQAITWDPAEFVENVDSIIDVAALEASIIK